MYDIAIVGARCAGAALAANLGKRGYHTLLIDQYAHPGPTLSTHIIGEVGVYDRLGIRMRMENAGAPPITRLRVDLNGSQFESDIIVTDRVLGLRRELFDLMLLDAAREQQTVDIRLGMNVHTVVHQADGTTELVARNRSGEDKVFAARIIVGADGRHSIVADRLGAKQQLYTHYSHGVLYLYASHVEALTTPTMEWYWHDGAIVIVNPIDKGLTCIAAMLPQETIHKWKPYLQASMLEWLQGIKMLAPRMKQMKANDRIRGIENIEGYIKQGYGSGWALVGDAGAHLHPVSGVGIDNAVCGAEHLAEAIHLYLSGTRDWESAMSEYVRLRDERIQPQYNAALKTLSRASEMINSDHEQWLKMICTFPSLVHGLGQRAKQIYTFITEGVTEV